MFAVQIPILKVQDVDYMNLDQICNGLKENKCFVKLDLSQNRLDEDSGAVIAALLADNKVITSLDLSGMAPEVSGCSETAVHYRRVLCVRAECVRGARARVGVAVGLEFGWRR